MYNSILFFQLVSELVMNGMTVNFRNVVDIYDIIVALVYFKLSWVVCVYYVNMMMMILHGYGHGLVHYASEPS